MADARFTGIQRGAGSSPSPAAIPQVKRMIAVSDPYRRKTGGNRTNPETDWVWSETPAHPAIISIELWKAAQGMRRRPETDWRRRPKSGRPARPFRGMVFCHCSRRMAAVQRARRTKEAVWY